MREFTDAVSPSHRHTSYADVPYLRVHVRTLCSVSDVAYGGLLLGVVSRSETGFLCSPPGPRPSPGLPAVRVRAAGAATRLSQPNGVRARPAPNSSRDPRCQAPPSHYPQAGGGHPRACGPPGVSLALTCRRREEAPPARRQAARATAHAPRRRSCARARAAPRYLVPARRAARRPSRMRGSRAAMAAPGPPRRARRSDGGSRHRNRVGDGLSPPPAARPACRPAATSFPARRALPGAEMRGHPLSGLLCLQPGL